jgi:ribosomal protein S18 acetylase RimI-like enzyme
MGQSVRLATIEDAERINDLRISAWRAAYRGIVPADYLAALDPRANDERRRGLLSETPPSVRHWVSEHAGRVVGWCETGQALDGNAGDTAHELWALYVDPDHWRRGHGTSLLRHVREDLRERGFTALALWVLEANSLGRAFYEREGFRAVAGERALAINGVGLPEVRYSLELGGSGGNAQNT